jgi:hypothetical protein
MDRDLAQPQSLKGAAGDFSQIQARIAGLPRASDAPRAARRGPAPMEEALINQAVISVRAERPSSQWRDYWRSGGFSLRMAYPENWRAYPSGDRLGVTFTPSGGVVEARGQTHLVYGAVINHYKPIGDNGQWTGLRQRSFRYIGGRGELIEATNGLIDSVLQKMRSFDGNQLGQR